MQPDQLIGDHDGVAVDDLGGAGQAIRLPNRCGAWCPLRAPYPDIRDDHILTKRCDRSLT